MMNLSVLRKNDVVDEVIDRRCRDRYSCGV